MSWEEMDAILDDYDVSDWDDDLIVATAPCRDCGARLPISYSRENDRSYWESLERAKAVHDCRFDAPLVTVRYADGRVVYY